MNEICANLSGLIVNIVILFLFFKILWPFIVNYISFIDSAVVALVVGLILRSKVFHGSLHPVFLILVIAALFAGCMWVMHTKYGFLVSSLLMSYIWTDFIVSSFKHWASYDLIWGIFIGVCSFALIFYFHYKDYRSLQATS